MPDTAAENFLRQLLSNPSDAFAHVNALVENGAEENEWREFKGADFFDNPHKEKKETQDTLKEYWSENLSAFANSGGGLLIWGIHAPQDVAIKQSFPRDAKAMANRLRELQNNAVDPVVVGVEVHAVVEIGGTAGFVVCFIPNSVYAPHRAVWAPGGYYLRAGDSNVQMRTEVLRRMFYPHTAPRLVPKLCLTVSQADGLLHVGVAVDVENRGMASAIDTYIEIVTKANRPFTPYPSELWRERRFSHAGFVCSCTIHPNETVSFLKNLAPRTGYDGFDALPDFLECKFKLFVQNSPALFATAIFLREELDNAVLMSSKIARDAKIVELQP